MIGKLGLERQVIFNKGAVMVLPTGVNKGTGLAAALRELKFSAHNVVGVGDAENDHSFLSLCECSVVVANALPALKEQADYGTQADHGAGVTELIEQILAEACQCDPDEKIRCTIELRLSLSMFFFHAFPRMESMSFSPKKEPFFPVNTLTRGTSFGRRQSSSR
jgi:hypothetical protein